MIKTDSYGIELLDISKIKLSNPISLNNETKPENLLIKIHIANSLSPKNFEYKKPQMRLFIVEPVKIFSNSFIKDVERFDGLLEQ